MKEHTMHIKHHQFFLQWIQNTFSQKVVDSARLQQEISKGSTVTASHGWSPFSQLNCLMQDEAGVHPGSFTLIFVFRRSQYYQLFPPFHLHQLAAWLYSFTFYQQTPKRAPARLALRALARCRQLCCEHCCWYSYGSNHYPGPSSSSSSPGTLFLMVSPR